MDFNHHHYGEEYSPIFQSSDSLGDRLLSPHMLVMVGEEPWSRQVVTYALQRAVRMGTSTHFLSILTTQTVWGMADIMAFSALDVSTVATYNQHELAWAAAAAEDANVFYTTRLSWGNIPSTMRHTAKTAGCTLVVMGPYLQTGCEPLSGRYMAHRVAIHARQPVSVGGHHAHLVGTKLPQHAVQDRATFFRAGCKRDVPDELVQLLGRHRPAAVEADGRKGGEFLARQPQQLELGLPALQADPLLAGGGKPDAGAGEFPDDFHQLARWQGDGAFLVDARCHRRADSDVEIGPRNPEAVLGGFEQDIGQHREGGLGGDTGRHGHEAFLELFACDRELHTIPTVQVVLVLL